MAGNRSKSKDNPQFLTTAQAADLMGVSESMVREFCARGYLPGAYQDRESGPWHIPLESQIP